MQQGPVLLLVDEARELARSHDNELVATALRTAITLNRDKLQVVVTGSSRTQLAGVFSNSNAPLYSSGVAITDFPLLDRNFVIFVLDKFRKASGMRMLDINEAWDAFTQLRYQPEPIFEMHISFAHYARPGFFRCPRSRAERTVAQRKP
jgi:hypothetical protein